jgi:hypothetical protein
MEELGQRFAELEAEDRQRQRHVGRMVRHRAALGSGAAAVAVAAILVLMLTSARPAHASSPVSRAPAAAEQAGTVRYRSRTVILVGGRPIAELSGQGILDFDAGSYQATVRREGADESIRRIRIGPRLYIRVLPNARRPTRAIEIPLGDQGLLSDPDLPGSAALTDPPAVLRAMSLIRRRPIVGPSVGIDGISTTEYRTSAPLASFFAHTAVAAEAGQQPVALRVWIDREGRPLRVRATLSSSEHHAMLITTWTFSSFGGPAHIVPPRTDIVDAGEGARGPDPLVPQLTALFLAPPVPPRGRETGTGAPGCGAAVSRRSRGRTPRGAAAC